MDLINEFMTNLSFTFPSSTEGAILDVKKGRSIISFTRDDLQFLSDIFDTIEMNDVEEDVSEGPIIDVKAEVINIPSV